MLGHSFLSLAFDWLRALHFLPPERVGNRTLFILGKVWPSGQVRVYSFAFYGHKASFSGIILRNLTHMLWRLTSVIITGKYFHRKFSPSFLWISFITLECLLLLHRTYIYIDDIGITKYIIEIKTLIPP